MANAENVHSELRRQPSYYLETFDVKVTSIGRVGGREEDTSTRLDVRLLVRRSDDGQTNLSVLMVKKNEIKDVTFDIMNLHRYNILIMYIHNKCVFSLTDSTMYGLECITMSVCKKTTLILLL